MRPGEAARYLCPMDQHRKDLVRAYKETPRSAGVGAVKNLASGKLLLLASPDIPALLNRHQAQLKLGAHRNAELQKDWNSLGAERFAFEVLDTLPPPETPDADPTEDLATLEDLWLEKLQPYEPTGYTPRPRPH